MQGAELVCLVGLGPRSSGVSSVSAAVGHAANRIGIQIRRGNVRNAIREDHGVPHSGVRGACRNKLPRFTDDQGRREERRHDCAPSILSAATLCAAVPFMECGPITDPQLHQQCLDSFARY
jgi:hypothetical protein